MKKWSLIGVLLTCLSLLAAPLMADEGPYKTLNTPLPTETGNKIEVLELFWYGCPHCFHLEPVINPWVAKLPKDVQFRRMPAIFRDSWEPYARAFYSFQLLGVQGKLHNRLFDAIHADGINLNSERALTDWAAQQGVDRKKFADAYNSFTVQTRVKRAAQLTGEYQITGVPSLVVDGRYVTSSAQAGGHEELLQVLDQLIIKARKERGGK